MFSSTGLISEEAANYRADIHVYIQRSGRISVAGYILSRAQRLGVLSHACLYGEYEEWKVCSGENRYSGEEIAKLEDLDPVVQALVLSIV